MTALHAVPLAAPSPYHIAGPAIISFSGGRTSGYMLRQILDAHGGTLPADVVTVFANTGKERPETLDFVRDCGAVWTVPIWWLERATGEHGQRFVEVNHNSACRSGEPFKALIDEKGYLPNPVTRFCTGDYAPVDGRACFWQCPRVAKIGGSICPAVWTALSHGEAYSVSDSHSVRSTACSL